MSLTPIPFHIQQNNSPSARSAPSLLALAAQSTPEEPPLGLYVSAVDALVHWQTNTVATGWVAMDPVVVRGRLQDFGHWYLGVYRQGELDTSAHKVIDSAMDTLTTQCLVRDQVPVHQSWSPSALFQDDSGFSNALPMAGGLGPITYDIATLVRDAKLVWEEPFVLEVTIRYWERARKAGLPVEPDFGEFYRGVEWAGVLQHLMRVGHLARLEGTSDAPELAMSEQTDVPVLLQYIRATCARYIELKPFLRLVERIEGVQTAGGYAFGRM